MQHGVLSQRKNGVPGKHCDALGRTSQPVFFPCSSSCFSFFPVATPAAAPGPQWPGPALPAHSGSAALAILASLLPPEHTTHPLALGPWQGHPHSRRQLPLLLCSFSGHLLSEAFPAPSPRTPSLLDFLLGTGPPLTATLLVAFCFCH